MCFRISGWETINIYVFQNTRLGFHYVHCNAITSAVCGLVEGVVSVMSMCTAITSRHGWSNQGCGFSYEHVHCNAITGGSAHSNRGVVSVMSMCIAMQLQAGMERYN